MLQSDSVCFPALSYEAGADSQDSYFCFVLFLLGFCFVNSPPL